MSYWQSLKQCLEKLLAVFYLMERFGPLGLLGILLWAIAGRWQIPWLKVIGIILSLPLMWIYGLILFVYLPFTLFDYIYHKSIK